MYRCKIIYQDQDLLQNLGGQRDSSHVSPLPWSASNAEPVYALLLLCENFWRWLRLFSCAQTRATAVTRAGAGWGDDKFRGLVLELFQNSVSQSCKPERRTCVCHLKQFPF